MDSMGQAEKKFMVIYDAFNDTMINLKIQADDAYNIRSYLIKNHPGKQS